MEGETDTSIADRVHRSVHRRLVFDRRRDRLVAALTAMLPTAPRRVLDIGCGSGEIGDDLRTARHRVVGVEVLAREGCAIPMARFDGQRLPFPDDAFDDAVIVDVLHHTANPVAVLREARRVTTGSVVLKDPSACCRRFLAATTNNRFGPMFFNKVSEVLVTWRSDVANGSNLWFP